MEIREILSLLKHALKELVHHKVAAVMAAIFAAFLIFFIGINLPQSYVSTALIQADRKSIIQPLLEGRASMTKMNSPTSVVIETLYSPTILERAARELGVIDEVSTGVEVEQARTRLSNFLTYEVVDDKLLRLSFASPSPEYSHRALSTIIDVFLQNSTAEKQAESAEAYRFISEQVEEYKQQLTEAEERLSRYKIENMDGTESQSFKRMTELRAELEEIEIAIDEAAAKTSSLRIQIQREGSLQSARSEQTTLVTQLRDAEANLQNLQLSFQDDYPDIISAKSQIFQLKTELADLRARYPNLPADTSEETTLFEDLRANLSEVELQSETLARRKTSLERILARESGRADQAAIDEAKLAELTRDYDKTKDIYEEMIQRRENAKLSMNIDQQGQGMTYRIQETPVIPLTSEGPQPIVFIAAAPFIAALLPIGLCFAYVLADPRLRYGALSRSKLPDGIDIIVNIPSYEKETFHIFQSRTNWMLILAAVLALILYGYLASFWLMTE